MKQNEVRAAIVERIKERRARDSASHIVRGLNHDVLETYPELSHREKAFAMHYVMHPGTYHQHAAYFNVSFGTIQNMMKNPRVNALIDDIEFNIMKYDVGLRVYIFREAMAQILRIFHAPEYPEALDAKRKTVHGVLHWFGIPFEDGEESHKPVNVNILSEQRPGLLQSSDDTVDINLGDIRREYAELARLEEYREDAHKQSRANNERQRSVKRIGGGFHEKPPTDVEISK